MRADLDLLCISVYCTADDLLPARPGNGRRKLTDAEIVTLCVAQVLMGITSDRRFLRAARRQLGHLFPVLPSQDALHKRRERLTDTIEWLIGVFAAQARLRATISCLLDSTPVECGRSLETTRRSDLADVCGYGYCKSHSRWFWGMRLHLLCAPDGTPELPPWSPPTVPNAKSPCRCSPAALHGGETIVCDKGYAGREFEHAVSELGGLIVRPARKDEPDSAHSSRADPATDRIGLPHLQRPAQPRTPRRPHRPTTSEPASPHGSSPSQPASNSTTNSDDPAAPSPTTPPNAVASII